MNSTTETTSTTTNATAGAEAAPAAPKKAAATRKPTATKAVPKAKRAAKAAKPATKKAVTKNTAAKKVATAAVPREFSKKQIVIDMLRAKGGATMAEIMKATDWQPHSVRGFISGALGKKMGLTIESTKNNAGDRSYRISK